MALLTDIPTEIIQRIVDLLPKTDLANLCLTNHSIRYHAEPCLYSTIDFKWSNTMKPPIILLLRTLLSRPELFALIDTFSLVGDAPRHRIVLGNLVPMSQGVLRLEIPSNVSLSPFISAIEKTEASYTDAWVARLKARHMDAFAGLLIAYLSNTTSLSITTNFIKGFALVGKILRSKALQFQPPRPALEADSDSDIFESDSGSDVLESNSDALGSDSEGLESDSEADYDSESGSDSEFGAPKLDPFPDQIPKFTQLKRLAYVRRLHEDDKDQYRPFEEAMSTLYLPNLVDVKLWLANPEEYYWPEGNPNLDHLTSLDIEWYHPKLLKKLLSLTRNLRSLTYSWDFTEDIDDEWKVSDLDLDEIITAISPTKHTLEKLHIKFRVGFGLRENWPEMDNSGSFNNLVEFDRIKELHVPFVALAGFGANFTPLDRGIPPSVETLILTRDMMEDPSFIWGARRPDMTGWGKDLKAWGESKRIWMPDHHLQSLVLLLAESCSAKFPRMRQILWFNLVAEHEYSDFERETERISRLHGVDIKEFKDERERYFVRKG